MPHRPSLAANRRLTLVVALCVAASSAIALATPGPTAAWSENAYSGASEADLVALTNQSRAAAGRASLKVSSTLTSIARWRSKDMITRDYFSHSIPGVGNVFDVLDDKGYCYHLAGENIGWNNEDDGVATARIHAMFMDSSSHRANILGKSWDLIGVGAYQGSDGRKMWTVLFADRAGCGSSSPSTTPKPTAKPKPQPKPTDKPKATSTPRPTRTPTPTTEPTATPSAAPSDPSASPEAIVSPEPSESAGASGFPLPEPVPTDVDPADDAVGSRDPGSPDGDHGRRILPAAEPPGLLDAIVGGVTGFFLGG